MADKSKTVLPKRDLADSPVVLSKAGPARTDNKTLRLNAVTNKLVNLKNVAEV